MVHNKTIFTITEIIFPQQGMVYQGITIVHERLEEKKLKTNQKSETWKEIWNFHFHYKLSMYLEKCFGSSNYLFATSFEDILRVSQDKLKTDLDPDPKSM